MVSLAAILNLTGSTFSCFEMSTIQTRTCVTTQVKVTYACEKEEQRKCRWMHLADHVTSGPVTSVVLSILGSQLIFPASTAKRSAQRATHAPIGIAKDSLERCIYAQWTSNRLDLHTLLDVATFVRSLYNFITTLIAATMFVYAKIDQFSAQRWNFGKNVYVLKAPSRN